MSDGNESHENAHRRIYGRGLFDGLRKAGIDDPEEFMRDLRTNEASSELTGLPKRILDAVPMQDEWVASKIMSELRRRGANPDHQFVMRCLNQFVRSGIIRETKPNVFTRKPLRKTDSNAIPAKVQEEIPLVKSNGNVSKSAHPSMDELAEIALRARQISAEIGLLAKAIDECAIEVEDRIQRAQQDGAKLRQFYELMKSID